MSGFIGPSEAAEHAIIAEISALGEREFAAVKAWIASDCEGPQPVPNKEEWHRLAAKLESATAAHPKQTE